LGGFVRVQFVIAIIFLYNDIARLVMSAVCHLTE